MQTVEEGRTWSWQAAVGDVQRDFTAEWMQAQTPPTHAVGLPDHHARGPAGGRFDLEAGHDATTAGPAAQHVQLFRDLARDILFVNTSNGVDESDSEVAAPEAPSFLALDKRTGAIRRESPPGANILHGQWSSPAAGVLGEVPQVIFAGATAGSTVFARAAEDGQPWWK